MNIDWNKAPEDATHFDASNFRINSFMKFDGNQWFYWPVDTSDPTWCQWGNNIAQIIKGMIERPKKQEVWGGVGLPPIGMASCEYLGAHKYDEWTVVNIFAHYGHTVFVDFGDGWRAEKDSSRFRPIKTAEQLAEEEKVAAIAEMQAVVMAASGCTVATISECLATVALYEAGYRKQ